MLTALAIIAKVRKPCPDNLGNQYVYFVANMREKGENIFPRLKMFYL